MLKTEIFTPDKPIDKENNDRLIDFMYEHLEQFGDPKEDIRKAVDYAMKKSDDAGGFIVTGHENGELVGAVIMNETGMEGYIPEWILVYIATHKDHRGKGLGKQLMKVAIEHAPGSVALHVEPDNPAVYLYRKFGFDSKYLEMRLKK